MRENEIEQPPNEYDTITDTGESAGEVAIISPTPFQFVGGLLEITGNTRTDNFAYYRLAYFQGLDPNNLVTIADNIAAERNNEVLGVWDVSELDGLYTLLLTVVRNDGSFTEVNVQVTIDNEVPAAEILFPFTDQTFFDDEEWLIVQAQVTDNISVDRVEFFVDGVQVPFAISTVPPFTEKWTIPGPGCHTFTVIAYDAAGNETTSNTVPVCVVARGG